MSVQGWNPNYGRAQPESNGSSTTLLACRICDKIFLSPHSLIQHYQTHENELSRARLDHRHRMMTTVTNFTASQKRDGTTQQQQQQRFHPYFPNGYRAPPVGTANNNNNTNTNINTKNLTTLFGGPNRQPNNSNPITLPLASSVLDTSKPPTVGRVRKTAGLQTVWYLGQLERRQMQKIVDVEKSSDTADKNLDLTLKL